MAITRYDGPETIAIALEDRESAKIIHAGGQIDLYHANESHEEIIDGPFAANINVGDTADWDNEIENTLRVQILDTNGNPANIIGGSSFLNEGDGVTEYEHVSETNVVSVGTSIQALGGTYSLKFTWTTHSGAVDIQLDPSHTDVLNVGLNSGDHIELKTSSDHVTIEQGPDYRPGLK